MKGIRNSWTREEEMAYCPNCGAKMECETDAVLKDLEIGKNIVENSECMYMESHKRLILTMFDGIMEMLKEYPTERRKSGKWVYYPEAYSRYKYGCSICRRFYPFATEFCPGCGSEMEGVEIEKD